MLDPAFVARSLLCAYSRDAATTDNPQHSERCGTTQPGWGVPQPIPPSATLAEAMQKQRVSLQAQQCDYGHGWIDSCYNEILLRMDGQDGWDNNLPNAVQAVVYSRLESVPSFYSFQDGGCYSCGQDVGDVRLEYARFLDHFGIGESAVPLLAKLPPS